MKSIRTEITQAGRQNRALTLTDESEPQIGVSVCRMYGYLLKMCEHNFRCTDTSCTHLHPEEVAQPNQMEGDPNASRRFFELLRDPVVARRIIYRAMKLNKEFTPRRVTRWYDAAMGFHIGCCSHDDGGGRSSGVYGSGNVSRLVSNTISSSDDNSVSLIIGA